ncbi:Hpt domain-containing protein, partial [Novosphingobium sp.]|uniref:Hpt domain-containing protein n=1 Tax=Novosphingobium sp. TaxID=1874826 RepID=UPI0038BACA81
MTAEEIQAIFFAECEESLAAAEQGLAACKAGTHDADTVNAVFRGVHSIKGGAGAFGYAALQGFTHTFETLLSDVRDGSVEITQPLVDLLLRALDTLSDHVTAARGQGDTPDDASLQAELTAAMAANAGGHAPAHVDEAPAAAEEPAPAASSPDDDFGFDFDSMLDDIAGAIGSPAGEGASEAEAAPEKRWLFKVRPHAGAMRNGSEPLLMLREMIALGGTCIECDVDAVPALDTLDPGTGYLGWTFGFPPEATEDSVREIFDFVGDECGTACGEGAPMPAVQFPAPRQGAPAPTAAPAPQPAPMVAPTAAATAAPAAPAEE